MNIEVLIVKNVSQNFYEVISISDIDTLLATNQQYIKASYISLLLIKDALSKGKIIIIPTQLKTSEVTPSDIFISDAQDDFSSIQNASIQFLLNCINNNISKISILTVIDYMTTYMKLLNAGICITDANREDKYFEIIEASQTYEYPKDLNEDASFDEQYQYSLAKEKYESAQDNLKTLETYLNSYDQLSKINFMHKLLHNIIDEIKNASTILDIDNIISKNKTQIYNYFYDSSNINYIN